MWARRHIFPGGVRWEYQVAMCSACKAACLAGRSANTAQIVKRWVAWQRKPHSVIISPDPCYTVISLNLDSKANRIHCEIGQHSMHALSPIEKRAKRAQVLCLQFKK